MSEVRTDPEVSAVAEAPQPVSPPKPRLHTHHINTLQSLSITVVIAVFVVTFIVQAFQIPSESMERTTNWRLPAGRQSTLRTPRFWEWLLPTAHPTQDIIVFRYPVSPERISAKRVGGIPRDRIRLINITSM